MRKLNDVTVKDAFPLPRIDQSLDALSDACYLSVVDASRGYFQVGLKEKDREKTAFIANNKLYQFRVMSLGLANAPSSQKCTFAADEVPYLGFIFTRD